MSQNKPVIKYNTKQKQYSLYITTWEDKTLVGFYNTVKQALNAFRIEQYRLYR